MRKRSIVAPDWWDYTRLDYDPRRQALGGLCQVDEKYEAELSGR